MTKKPTSLVVLTAILSASALLANPPPTVVARGSGGALGGFGPYQSDSGINNWQGGEITLSESGLDLSAYSRLTVNQGDAPVPSFQTFCVEGDVNIYSGQYSSVALSGTTSVGDNLTAGAAWLYDKFAGGTLSGYDYTDTAGRLQSAGALQDAIWSLMNNTGGIGSVGVGDGQLGMNQFNNSANPFLLAAEGEFGGWNGADTAVAAGTDGVYVMNLKDLSNGGDVQNQLYLDAPDGGQTLILLGGTLFGLALYRRRGSR